MSPISERVRCEGSLTEPVEKAESRGRPTGRCSGCGGWYLTLKSGLVKEHRVAPAFDGEETQAVKGMAA